MSSADRLYQRTCELLAALGGAPTEDLELAGIVESLGALQISKGKVADVIVEALASCARRPVRESRWWDGATVAAALVAALCGALGLRAIFEAMGLAHLGLLALLPLAAFPAAVLHARGRARKGNVEATEQSARVAVQLARAMTKAEVPGPLAVAAARCLAEADPRDLAGLLPERSSDPTPAVTLAVRSVTLGTMDDRMTPRRLRWGPTLIAVWVVLTYWWLYFSALGWGVSELGTGS